MYKYIVNHIIRFESVIYNGSHCGIEKLLYSKYIGPFACVCVFMYVRFWIRG